LRFLAFRQNRRKGLAASRDGGPLSRSCRRRRRRPGFLDSLIRKPSPDREAAALARFSGQPVDPSSVAVLQPLESPAKIICVGLNYRDHAGESGMQVPSYPTLFARFASSLIPYGAPITCPAD
jgi:2-keto-4-pentenoate hydratase/2-oxohepta-3-ene-1,7-dioic acid hydratase in catechol pathway